MALQHGHPHFNVVDQKVEKLWNEKLQTELSVVEGTIQLSGDPMNAEYDAYEIDKLVLTDYAVE